VFQEEFVAACESSSNLGPALCACMARKAETDLSADERGFVLAGLRDDEAEVNRLRGMLGVDGAMRAGMFMTNVSSCAAGG
jgi:hypothetical protein